jgi:hypothetical protein
MIRRTRLKSGYFPVTERRRPLPAAGIFDSSALTTVDAEILGLGGTVDACAYAAPRFDRIIESIQSAAEEGRRSRLIGRFPHWVAEITPVF